MFAVVGPTGAGKSALGLQLAAALHQRGISAEIIGADAMQLYRGMDIGTAKVGPAERQRVRHHMIDVLDPPEEASVSAYQRQVTQLIAELEKRHTVPILVGGSGLYVNSVLYRMDFAPHDPRLRHELEERLAVQGIDTLVAQLLELDPAAADTVDTRNPRRVVRALEVLSLSQQPLAAQLPRQPQLLRPTIVLGVNDHRPALTARLDARVVTMWQQGMLAEVLELEQRGLRQGRTASQAIGYRQALAQLDGDITEAEAIAQTQLLTRRYARRQVSWFKRLPQLEWLSSGQVAEPATVTALTERYLRLRD